MQVPLTWPLQISFDGKVPVVTSGFESHLQRSRTPGVDIAYREGLGDQAENTVAAAPGTVARAGTDSHGSFVELSHPGGLSTVYRHMRNLAVKKGDVVMPGTPLGKTSFSPADPEKVVHVHFEVKHGGRFLDPEALLKMVAPTRPGQKAQMVDVSALRAKLAKAKRYTTGNGALVWILILLLLSHN
jgi:murein DD-endopeptidase MepM/ murein hydrolase activator NlpD